MKRHSPEMSQDAGGRQVELENRSDLAAWWLGLAWRLEHAATIGPLPNCNATCLRSHAPWHPPAGSCLPLLCSALAHGHNADSCPPLFYSRMRAPPPELVPSPPSPLHILLLLLPQTPSPSSCPPPPNPFHRPSPLRLLLLPQLPVHLRQRHHRLNVEGVVGAQLLHHCLVDLQREGRGGGMGREWGAGVHGPAAAPPSGRPAGRSGTECGTRVHGPGAASQHLVDLQE